MPTEPDWPAALPSLPRRLAVPVPVPVPVFSRSLRYGTKRPVTIYWFEVPSLLREDRICNGDLSLYDCGSSACCRLAELPLKV